MLTMMGPTRQAPFPFFPIRVPRSSGHRRRPPLSPPWAPHIRLASPCPAPPPSHYAAGRVAPLIRQAATLAPPQPQPPRWLCGAQPRSPCRLCAIPAARFARPLLLRGAARAGCPVSGYRAAPKRPRRQLTSRPPAGPYSGRWPLRLGQPTAGRLKGRRSRAEQGLRSGGGSRGGKLRCRGGEAQV
ncbi:hypothetical protein PVAP13_7KG121591 [Panicum virgatum]|uniref:Uncharacterized protein n=1 Tax=Panicum virgatum TaxID=38727 RepID=A0A8T0QEC8_PANVG|nr:hypothetical protein PVAP13_7KG121591 [Panicum virgatum]